MYIYQKTVRNFSLTRDGRCKQILSSKRQNSKRFRHYVKVLPVGCNVKFVYLQNIQFLVEFSGGIPWWPFSALCYFIIRMLKLMAHFNKVWDWNVAHRLQDFQIYWDYCRFALMIRWKYSRCAHGFIHGLRLGLHVLEALLGNHLILEPLSVMTARDVNRLFEKVLSKL